MNFYVLSEASITAQIELPTKESAMIPYSLPLLAPLILIAAAFYVRSPRGAETRHAAKISEYAMLAALTVIVLTSAVLVLHGAGTGMLFGIFGAGLSARVDVLSVIMLLLVAFVGWVVVRYARVYLDGEPGQSNFTCWLLATVAAVLLLVQSGNLVQFVLAWIATSFFLHKLLLFYPVGLPRNVPHARNISLRVLVMLRCWWLLFSWPRLTKPLILQRS